MRKARTPILAIAAMRTPDLEAERASLLHLLTEPFVPAMREAIAQRIQMVTAELHTRERHVMMQSHRFCDLPLGTRFVYDEAMWIKLAHDAAQNIQPEDPREGRVHYLNSLLETLTA